MIRKTALILAGLSTIVGTATTQAGELESRQVAKSAIQLTDEQMDQITAGQLRPAIPIIIAPLLGPAGGVLTILGLIREITRGEPEGIIITPHRGAPIIIDPEEGIPG